MAKCSIAGCHKEARQKGWCWAHYSKWRKYGDPSVQRRAAPNTSPPAFCTIEGCNKSHLSKGLCRMHYTRVHRHGDAETRLIAGHGEALEWLKTHVSHDGDGCLHWPFSSNAHGYGVTRYRGIQQNASRIMCILAHGDPPEENMDSAHSCGRGALGCVHPKHVRWATRTENHADKKVHGTHLCGENIATSKLSEADVIAIRTGAESVQTIVERYGISRSHVYDVRAGRRWAHLL